MGKTLGMGRAAKRKAGPELQGLPVRLAGRMSELGWSDGELGRRTGLSRSVVTRIRNGSACDGLTCETAILIAGAIGVSLDWLLRGAEPTHGSRSVSPAVPAVGLGNVPNIVEPTEDRRIFEAAQRALQTLLIEAAKNARDPVDPSLGAPKSRYKRPT